MRGFALLIPKEKTKSIANETNSCTARELKVVKV